MLNKLKPFCFFADFDLGATACPFIPFCPGSATLPLPSTAIFYSMQVSIDVVLTSAIRYLALLVRAMSGAALRRALPNELTQITDKVEALIVE